RGSREQPLQFVVVEHYGFLLHQVTVSPRCSAHASPVAQITSASEGRRTSSARRCEPIQHSKGTLTITTANWPASTPALKPNKAPSRSSVPACKAFSAVAKPNPCTRPNANAICHDDSRKIGSNTLSPASATDSAMTHSTTAVGTSTSPNTAAARVRLCA